METKLISRSIVQEFVSMGDVVDIVDKTYSEYGEGRVINPAKVGLDLGERAIWPPYGGFMNAMPAYVGWKDMAGIKWAGGFLGNKEKGLPYIQGMILLIDPSSGEFLSVMDGALITNMRTGAQTAAALKHLVYEDSIELGLFGAGMQGHYQVRAIAEVFTIKKLIVYDRVRVAAKLLQANLKDLAEEIRVADSPTEVAEAPIIVTATTAKAPFIKNSWIQPGSILFALGSYQECEDDFIKESDFIVVDSMEQCLHRGALKRLSEKKEITEKNIFATIGELAAGKKALDLEGRKRALCIPIGMGSLDIAVAAEVYKRAVAKGQGETYSFDV